MLCTSQTQENVDVFWEFSSIFQSTHTFNCEWTQQLSKTLVNFEDLHQMVQSSSLIHCDWTWCPLIVTLSKLDYPLFQKSWFRQHFIQSFIIWLKATENSRYFLPCKPESNVIDYHQAVTTIPQTPVEPTPWPQVVTLPDNSGMKWCPKFNFCV